MTSSMKILKKKVRNYIAALLVFMYKSRNCLVKQIIEGKINGQIEVRRRRGRRSKKQVDDLKDRRGYCQLKEEILDRRSH